MIFNTIKNKGYYETDSVISDDDLAQLKSFVLNKIKKYPNTNFRLYEKDLEDSIINNKIFIKKITKLIDEFVNEEFEKFKNKKSNIYKVLRIVSGENQKSQSHLYHFDAHLVTILIPILIPDNVNKKNGDLVIFPNIRKTHNFLLLNIMQKIFFQNNLIRYFLQLNFIKKLFNHKIIKIKPGNIYLFNGFSSLHGNLEIDQNSTRATLLIHSHDIFKKSKLINLNRKISINKEIKKIN